MNPTEISKSLVDLMKLKRKIKRSLNINPTEENKHLVKSFKEKK